MARHTSFGRQLVAMHTRHQGLLGPLYGGCCLAAGHALLLVLVLSAEPDQIPDGAHIHSAQALLLRTLGVCPLALSWNEQQP